jgi:hypothetical protein
LDSPPPYTWEEENTIHIIIETCGFSKSAYTKVKRIITQVHNGIENDDDYEYDGRINHKGGRPSTIPKDSVEESIIADKLYDLPPFIFSKKTSFPIKKKKFTLALKQLNPLRACVEAHFFRAL